MGFDWQYLVRLEGKFKQLLQYFLFIDQLLSQLMRQLLLFTLGILFFSACQNNPAPKAPDMESSYELLVGTYSKKEGHVDGKAEGIHQFAVNANGSLSGGGAVASNIINPSYLTLSKDGQFMYAASETGPDVDTVGYIYAYAKQASGEWKFLNRQSSHSFAPCYVAVHPSGRYVSVANYVGGTIAMYPIAEDGSLKLASAVMTLEGGSEHPRQDSSHPHATVFSPDGQYMFVPDLGANKVWVFKVDIESGTLEIRMTSKFPLQNEAGPRHLALHPNGSFAYLANELDNTVVVYDISDVSSINRLQTLSTLPEQVDIESYVADIHLTPNGEHLYVSNRGHNTLAHFVVDTATGMLTAKNYHDTKGDFPRNFVIHPDGSKLYVANQNTDTIVGYEIRESGDLSQFAVVESPTPVCLKFRLK